MQDPTENPTTMVLLSGGMKSSLLLLELVRLRMRPVQEALIIEFDDPMSYFPPAKAMADRAEVPFSYWSQALTAFLDVAMIDGPALDEYPLEQLRIIQMLAIAGARAKERGYQQVATGFTRTHLQVEMDDLLDIQSMIGQVFDLSGKIFDHPYLDYTTDEFFWQAKELGVLGEILAYTNSCLEGDHETKQEGWGYGCGECPGCVDREAGWHQYLRRLEIEG